MLISQRKIVTLHSKQLLKQNNNEKTFPCAIANDSLYNQ